MLRSPSISAYHWVLIGVTSDRVKIFSVFLFVSKLKAIKIGVLFKDLSELKLLNDATFENYARVVKNTMSCPVMT